MLVASNAYGCPVIDSQILAGTSGLDCRELGSRPNRGKLCVARIDEPAQFTRVFANQLRTSPAQYVEQLRVETARRLLEETEQGVEEIAAAFGFSSAELMRRAFLRSIEAAPSQYRERFRSATLAPLQPPQGSVHLA